MKYRPDIDGLRAIAVLPVFFFHVGVSGFSGGFVGVDIFFVISGFLITSIVVKDLRAGTFSFLHFYERRIRRIFPALFTVLGFSFVAASLLFLPQDFQNFSQSLAAASLSLSNFLYWQEAGYFDGPAEIKPLLHTWSLAVEEQYYVVFPLMLWVFYHYGSHRFFVRLYIFGVLSFILSLWGVYNAPSATFYLIHTRAWELFLGGVLALRPLPLFTYHRINDALALVGMGLIVFSVMFYDRFMPFPGAAALIPCFGAGLIIHCGRDEKSWLASVLSWKPFVFTGLISYSLYLWHWPLIIFAKYYLMRPLTAFEIFLIIVLSFGLSVFSWRFIEKPCRNQTFIHSRLSIFISAALLIAIAVSLGALGHLTKGLPQRLPKIVAEMSSKAYEDRILALPDRHHCLGSPQKNKDIITRVDQDDLCLLGQSKNPPRFLLWGDSHAEAIRSVFIDEAQRLGVSGVFAGYSACPPALGIVPYDRPNSQCKAFNQAVLHYLERHSSIRHVVMHVRWPFYIEESYYKQESGKPLRFARKRSITNEEVLQEKMAQTIETLQARGIQVYLWAGTPEIGIDVSNAMAKKAFYGHSLDLNAVIAPSRSEFDERQARSMMFLEAMSQRYNLTLYKPHKFLCNERLCPVIDGNGQPLYRDDDHVSVHGVALIQPLVRKFLKPLSNEAG